MREMIEVSVFIVIYEKHIVILCTIMLPKRWFVLDIKILPELLVNSLVPNTTNTNMSMNFKMRFQLTNVGRYEEPDGFNSLNLINLNLMDL